MTESSRKIPIKVQPLFWLIAFFIGWVSATGLMNILLAVLVIFISVIIHEMGHALTATLFGQRARIELAAFGGFTYREGRRLKLWEEFLVVLNGPLSGFLIFLISWFVLTFADFKNPALLFTFKFATIVNLFWTIVNLVPVLPLDGGHLLSIVLEAIFGFRGVKMAVVVGLVIAIAVSIFFFAIGAFLIGALFLLLTFESFRSLRYYKLFTERDRDYDIQELMKRGEEELRKGSEESALAKFEEVRAKAKAGILYTMATEEMARILKSQERYEEAYKLLSPIQKTLSQENTPLLHQLAFLNRDFPKVAELSKESYQLAPSAETALMNALSFAEIKESDAALGWLECAFREGIGMPKKVLSRHEWDAFRGDPRFQKLEEKVKSP